MTEPSKEAVEIARELLDAVDAMTVTEAEAIKRIALALDKARAEGVKAGYKESVGEVYGR